MVRWLRRKDLQARYHWLLFLGEEDFFSPNKEVEEVALIEGLTHNEYGDLKRNKQYRQTGLGGHKWRR